MLKEINLKLKEQPLEEVRAIQKESEEIKTGIQNALEERKIIQQENAFNKSKMEEQMAEIRQHKEFLDVLIAQNHTNTSKLQNLETVIKRQVNPS